MFVEFLLIFLIPIALYCLALASINRRDQPVMVAGTWDAVGLLFACSGVLLGTGPGILQILFLRGFVGRPDSTFQNLWLEFIIVWIIYFSAIVVGSLGLIRSRRFKTSIYNVDADHFPRLMEHVLQELGYSVETRPEGWTFRTAGEVPGPILHVGWDPFPALCHVTLNFSEVTPGVRQTVETELRKNLAFAKAEDNPSASWLLGVSGMVFGMLFLGAVVVILTILFPRRW